MMQLNLTNLGLDIPAIMETIRGKSANELLRLYVRSIKGPKSPDPWLHDKLSIAMPILFLVEKDLGIEFLRKLSRYRRSAEPSTRMWPFIRTLYFVAPDEVDEILIEVAHFHPSLEVRREAWRALDVYVASYSMVWNRSPESEEKVRKVLELLRPELEDGANPSL